MSRIPLSRFEALAQRLVEDSFKRLFGGRLESLEIASRLAHVLEDNQENGIAPELFTIQLHPTDLELLIEEHPSLAAELGEYVHRLAQSVGLSSTANPRVRLLADASQAPRELSVTAEHVRARGVQTTQLHRVGPAKNQALAALRELDAFLIIEGHQHIPLQVPQLTLGRRTDNDIVLDAPAVSRQHAQIRWRHGKFVLYDLGGRRRTAVNGRSVRECVLKPGDVIALSNVLIIYGEGDSHTSSHSGNDDNRGQTQLFRKL